MSRTCSRSRTGPDRGSRRASCFAYQNRFVTESMRSGRAGSETKDSAGNPLLPRPSR